MTDKMGICCDGCREFTHEDNPSWTRIRLVDVPCPRGTAEGENTADYVYDLCHECKKLSILEIRYGG